MKFITFEPWTYLVRAARRGDEISWRIEKEMGMPDAAANQ